MCIAQVTYGRGHALGLGNMPFLVLFGLSDDDGSLRAFALNCAARGRQIR